MCIRDRYDRHCTCHHISTKALKSIILKTIQETCHYVSLNEREFVYSLQEESAMKDIAASETVKNRIERNQKRVHELDMLIRKIYEDNVIGRLPDRLFQSMLTDYENEQNELNKIIETDTADMQRIIGGQNNVERFLKLVKKYENITELTPAMINEFIDKILVHEPQGKGADRTTEAVSYTHLDVYKRQLHDGVFTLAEVQGELEMLFEKQYILTETVTMQIRYRTKMMVIIGPYGVPQVITYQEPYEYYICTVKLKNKDLSHLPVEVLTEEQLSAYSLYMRTLGNRPDLFGQAQYPNASTIKQPTYYDIPPEALKDDKFAAMMEEATKYIGYPYVWGGSSPSTSFDCSGYISWVLNHSCLLYTSRCV